MTLNVRVQISLSPLCWVTYFDTANSLFQKEAPRILDVGRSVGIANLTI